MLSKAGLVLISWHAGLSDKKAFDAMGTLLGKLVFQLHFYILHKLKKLKWNAIKAAAREWACITSLKLEKSHRLFAVQK